LDKYILDFGDDIGDITSGFFKRHTSVSSSDVEYVMETMLNAIWGEEMVHKEMFIEIYFKDDKEKVMLSQKKITWKGVVESIEKWLDSPEGEDSKENIKYVSIKANDIRYFKVNIFKKNLTNKVELLLMKENPND
jgi:hypothetical protein